MLDRFINAFSGDGALFMYAIVLVAAYALTISLERIWLFWFSWKCDWTTLNEAISDQKWTQCEEISKAHPVHALFEQSSSLPEGADPWDALSCAAPQIESTVQQRLSMLSATGSVATMLGLLGTVYGLIMALQGLDQTNILERSSRLSEGISTAMITTAGGLLVGIPALAMYAFLNSKANRMLSHIESTAARIARHKK